MTDVGRVKITLDVSYRLNGASLNEVIEHLNNEVGRAIGMGLLYYGFAPVEVPQYALTITPVGPAVREPDARGYLNRLLDAGSLTNDDISHQMVRFGLMEPEAFSAELLSAIAAVPG